MAPKRHPTITPAQFERAAALFAEALARGISAEEIGAYASSAAPGDDAVARELAAMLRAHLAEEEGEQRAGLETRADALIEREASAAEPSLSAALPASIGPFRIQRHLGAGGMGTVYEATEPSTGHRVALKVLHPWLAATPGAIARFRREAETGVAIQHENVVRTLEFGSDEDAAGPRHYLVMEYVEGKTLRTLQDELGCVPESLLTEIGRQAACGLEAIHAHGVLHRDIKPENILITDDQRVRIMDLGIAKVVEADVALTELTHQGQFIGSLAYAAPEQSLGASVGPATDRYALGVLLYELAAGTNPFRSDAPIATIRAHADKYAAPLASTGSTVSPFFSAVVGTLLAKDPEQRFPSTTALLEALTGGESSAWWKERRDASATRPRVAVERATQLCGRQQELDQLRAAVATLREGKGATVVITGEAGSGKTRLIAELLAEPALEDVELLYGGFSPHKPFGGLLSALRQRFGESDAGAGLSPFLAEPLRSRIGDLLADTVPAAGLHAQELTAALVRVLHGLSSDRPVVWVVEDVHFGSEEEREVIRALAHASRDRPVLMLLTARPTPRPLLGDLVPPPTVVPMSRLGEAEVTALLEDAFQDGALALQLGAAVTARSDGIPLFVLGVIEALKQQGIVEHSADGYGLSRRIEELTVPDALQDQVARRLEDLSVAGRRIIDAAAVAGFEFDPFLLAAALDEPLVRVLQELAELERFTGLVRSQGRTYRFDHHLVYEVAYERLAPLLREALHTRLGDAVQERRGPCEEAVHHHLRGTRPEAALEERALERTLERCSGRAEAAEGYCRRALAIEGLLTGEARADILLRHGELLYTLGRPDDVRAAVEEVEAIAEREGLVRQATEARILWLKLELMVRQLDLEEILRLADEAAAAAQALGDDAMEFLAASFRIHIFAAMARSDEALEACRRTHEIAVRMGDRRRIGLATSSLAIELFKRRYADVACEDPAGDTKRVEALFAETLAIGEELDDVRLKLSAHANHGMVLLRLGRFTDARPHIEKQHAYSVSVGDLRGEAMAFGSLGLVRAAEGRLEEAVSAHRRAADLMDRFGHRVGVIHNKLWTGEVLAASGNEGGARAEFEAALELARAVGTEDSRALILAAMSRSESALGTVEEALRLAEAGWAIVKDEPNSESHIAVALARAAAWEMGGDAGAARDLLRGVADALDGSVLPRLEAEVRIHLALHEGDAVRAHELLRQYEDRIEATVRVDLHGRLFRATNDRAHLMAAHGLLQTLLETMSEEGRDALRAMPMHRAILDAEAALD